MANVLLGWELGSNRGHVKPLLDLGTALEARGDTVAYALQQVDALSGFVPRSAVIMQAPLWPRLLKTVTQPPAPTTATMGDILARIGLVEPGTLSSMIAGWDALISMFKPDLVVGDFAPALSCAARGRVPIICMGSSFCLPPASMPEFPSFFADIAPSDQGELLALVNQELARSGRAAIGALPQLFGANREIVTGFTELDVYHPWRAAPLFSPSVDMDPSFDLASPLNRNEIFVYYYQAVGPTSLLWDALEMTQLPIRVYVPRLDPQEISALQQRNFVVERHPIAWSDIALRSRMVLSHGGSGFVSSALAHGIPQVIAYYDVEKLLIARAVGELGLGLHVHALKIDPLSLSEAIVDLYYDQACATRVEDASHYFRNQLANSALIGSIIASDELLDRG